NGNSHFGGIVGAAYGNFRIENVHVSGSLRYGVQTAGYWLLVGGIIGQLHGTGNGIIENCSVDLDIIGNLGTYGQSSGNLIGVGGIIGKATTGGASPIIIKNCYTKGTIDVKAGLGRSLNAGGLIGTIANSDTSVTSGAWQIINCYSTMDIKAVKEGGTVARWLLAGGLVGYFNSSNADAKIENSAALNPRVLIETVDTPAALRMAGRITSAKHATPTFTGNYALSTMLIGDGNGAEAAENDTADGINGASAAAAAMDAAWWTGTLGFDPAVWDFTGLNVSGGSYPKLKTQF
ncbi:MAG: hypothetical protein LBD20_01045, partial [Spirochaetaceae bacterium]|nr:hypothetical protein [Spirochaetaceae bacterium]